MTLLLQEAKARRSFISKNLEIDSWQKIEEYFNILHEQKINSSEELRQWLLKRSELEAVLEEEKAWKYIRLSCDTGNAKLAEDFNRFTSDIEPLAHKQFNSLDKKLIADYANLEKIPYYEVFIRCIRQGLEIFRDDNVKLLSELEIKEQEYSAVTGAMTIHFDNREITLQEAQNYLKSTDRNIRKEVFEQVNNRRISDRITLDNLLTELIDKRTEAAHNADFENYRDFRFAQMNRFDYSSQDCFDFHAAIKSEVVPLVDEILGERKSKLGYKSLKPYDLDVDVDQKPALKPFSTIEELIEKTISCLSEISEEFGSFISVMDKQGYLDLGSRKGKAPGGYNYPLHESNVPFIFMNATNNLRDLVTMVHESGHAIHSFLSRDLDFVYYKELTPEIAELASMSMELISMEHWHHFFNEDDLVRAKKIQLEQVIGVLPWVATVDKFQHWLYTHPNHTVTDRTSAWVDISNEFGSSVIDWTDYPDFYSMVWQKQIHIFQFPFYYIEYAMAQLGAIAIWKNYKQNKNKTIEEYKAALSAGYSKPIPEIYNTAGIEFNFKKEYIRDLMNFVQEELNSLH